MRFFSLHTQNNLLKRLESATKELRINTKTKKTALTKLEEATTNVDNLKQELEQLTRDKEILESKMKVLQEEYEKLQERALSNKSLYETNPLHSETPERDSYGYCNLSNETRQNQTDYNGDDSPINKVCRFIHVFVPVHIYFTQFIIMNINLTKF